MRRAYFLLALVAHATARAPSGGDFSSTVDIPAGETSFIAFIHPSYNNTRISAIIHCNDDAGSVEFEVQWTLRSTPCHREFIALMQDSESLAEYFNNPGVRPDILKDDIKSILFYQSDLTRVECQQGVPLSVSKKGYDPRTALKEYDFPGDKKSRRRKRESGSTSSGHTLVTTVADADYMLIIRIKAATNVRSNVTVETKWLGPNGYLSAIDYPLYEFYCVMCGLYAVLAVQWLCMSACYWQDILRIQFWIGAVILLGMTEKAVFVSEYSTINASGKPVTGVIQFAEIVSAAKRTLARMLILVVSIGYGVVKPRLGDLQQKIVAVGGIYFTLSCIEANVRVSRSLPNDAEQQRKLAMLPLVITDVAIFYWIFTALTDTMRALRLRRNEVKLSLYRHFTNTLIFSVIGSTIFMCWSLAKHVLNTCFRDWKEIWVDDAFWHMFFCVILIVIMILWRPSANNQRYAFTPLLDEGSDDDEDELFNDAAFTTGADGDSFKIRMIPSTTAPENRKERSRDAQTDLEKELKWVDENIPSSLADRLAADSEEEEQQTKFEVSKMQ